MDCLIYTQHTQNLSNLQKGYNTHSVLAIHNNLASTLQCLKENTFQNVILDVNNVHDLQQVSLHNLYSILKPGGSLKIHTASQEVSNGSTFKDLYTIAGFKEEGSESSGVISLKKPDWAGKGVATLKKKNGAQDSTSTVKVSAGENNQAKQVEAEKPEAKKANPFAKFKIDNTDDSKLINEENLLQNEQGYKNLGQAEDCSTKPKACANCSCGRAEQEAKEEANASANIQKKIETGKVTSSCGNCYLGDAFRCGSCPYKGLPAFKPGDKVKLDLSKDSVGGVLKEENDIVVSNGKVKLQI